MKLIVFLLVYQLYHTLAGPVYQKRNYLVEEEDINRMTYFLVETSDGTYRIEDLTNYDVEVQTSVTDIIYYFYSRSNENGTAITNNITSTLPSDVFNPEKEVLVIIHGWLNNHNSPVNTVIKSAALDIFDLNVIVVDWGAKAYTDYITARFSVPQIGKYVGEFIKSLTTMYDVPLSMVSIVGHSLGAHVSGIAGSFLEAKVNHIVGLDPAAPLVSISDKDFCLDPSDAEYVEVIHTSAAFLGLSSSLGHSDYFPNGGKKQPGCGLDFAGSCSHGRAYEYYAESIRYSKFLAQQCSSYKDFTQGTCKGMHALMGGYNIETRITGDFYLDTNKNSPYALNEED